MTLLDWLPPIATTSIFALLLWLCKNLIATRLTKSVQFEFDEKLEAVRAELRNSEEAFKAELRAKETEIADLRSGAISAMASRQMALDKRRLEAVDQLWSAFTKLGPAKGIALHMAVINFEAVAKQSATDARLRDTFALMDANHDARNVDLSESAKARPFVSPMAWALFTAYQTIVMQAVAKLEIIKLGIGEPDLLDKAAITKLVKAALPHYEEYIDKHGDAVYHYFLDELEANLLVELRKMMTGEESDMTSIKQAALILNLSNAIMDASNQNKAAGVSDFPQPPPKNT